MTTSTAAPCPVCTHTSFAERYRAIGHRFDACQRCGFTRMADPLSSPDLAQHYAQDRQYGEIAYQEHATNLVRFDEILQRIERFVPVGRFLDIGCSIGTTLVAAQKRGWQAIGLELSQPSADYGRANLGVDIRSCLLRDAGFAQGSFDAILMHHTLEHVEQPDQLIGEIRALLRPGGVMYQSLPNHGSLKARLLGPQFGYGIVVEHLSHFDRRTLRRMVERMGLQVVASHTRSYRADPRLLWDLAVRFGQQRWLERKCGLAEGQSMDPATWLAFLTRTPWARWICDKAWPARLCTWLGLGEDMHLIAKRT